ncbi:NAD(P)/FAD-dependent oxidoreductase [Rhodoligotrophos defluvii]|uniref:NAD(P)/FAD-dependent oxidoreductase n=1 Tax=Rhodoligotrophos defluvii TaxID=2561934 RepID=UPI0010C9CACB|nr:FAD-binding oxidoreductase [Rhodoligotrophos defluvii]
MQPAYDVVIVGGGVIGSAVAYFLSANADFGGKVAVVERDPYYTASSSSLSTSAIRQQFGTRPNIEMSAYSIAFLRQVKERLSVDGYEADIGLREPGYLILGGKEDVAIFESRNAVQKACGFDAELLSPAELGQRYPWLNTEDLGIGSYGPEKEGWFDGPALLQAFRRKARAQGVEYIADTVVGLDMAAPGHIGAVQLASGGRLATGIVVNAAGAWSGGIARMAGIDLPVVPRKRCIFVFETPAEIASCPFIFDTSGTVVRPEGHLYICGITPPRDNAPDDFGLDVDYDLFDELIWPALAHRVPGFEQLRLLRAWAGLYEYNTFDHSAVIGRHPEVTNLILATGFSGHGMMHSPAAGAGVSELITYGDCRSIDLTPFAFERIAENRRIEEHVY